ncbi:MAG: GTPase HflX [Anaerolineae bacterium]|nr:GTPase HflX [Anaerolineae bacterium]
MERAFLVGAQLKGGNAPWPLEESLAELAQLARTAGLEVVGQTAQQLERINPATFIGRGKVEELKELHRMLRFDVVIFDDELSPRQLRELEKALGEDVKILDRTALILDIFARHARTREGALQVELAQYQYRLPRLTRQWQHLSRQTARTAAGVGLRGPGETQLEVDRREIQRRMARIRRELEEVRRHRARYRRRRARAGMPVVAIVGYTNAGKSTLLNALSGADVLVEDKLFATLDPTTRRVRLPGGRHALFTDTVGFIQKLPPTLVAAFRATLEEINEADLLLHVVDVTHPQAVQQSRTVAAILEDLGAGDRPMLVALNKVDRLSDPQQASLLAATGDNALPISALRGQGLDALVERVEEILERQMRRVRVHIPHREAGLVALFHEHGLVESEEHDAEGTWLTGSIPEAFAATFAPYEVGWVAKPPRGEEDHDA